MSKKILQSPQVAKVIDEYTVATIPIIIPAVASTDFLLAFLYILTANAERQRPIIAIGNAKIEAQ